MADSNHPPVPKARRAPVRVDGPEDFQRAFDVSHETLDRLIVYADLIAQWQKAQNLISPKTLEDVWQRHFADSAQLLDLVPEHARNWWDLGSGAGLPGLVLAVLLDGKETADKITSGNAPLVHLVESNGRKCAFLHEVARRTGVTVEIHNQRIELPPDSAKVGAADVITARALAPLERLLGLAAPYFGSRSTALFLKGRGAHREISDAEQFWCFTWNMISSRTDPDGAIVEIKDLRPV